MAVKFDCSHQQQETNALEENHDFHNGTANIVITWEQ